jgi:hypothetical protein
MIKKYTSLSSSSFCFFCFFFNLISFIFSLRLTADFLNFGSSSNNAYMYMYFLLGIVMVIIVKRQQSLPVVFVVEL